MKCGCAPTGILSGPGIEGSVPGCGTHWVVEPMDNQPDLTGRIASCTYGNHGHTPSSPDLAFFEYRGPNSRAATMTCKCGYYKTAHERDESRVRPEPIKCTAGGFTPRGPLEDFYYCGCRGWD